jgi:tRNA A37 threonylcarbamoyladenosine synthetase subunit TsaC/SUA5/YrdC
MYITKYLNITNPMHIEQATELINQGEIIVAGFNGLFGIFGDANRLDVANKIFMVKNRPQDKNLILVCPPEFLHEHVNLEAIPFQSYSIEKIKRLYQEAFAIGLILPAAIPGAPAHLVKNGTILNIWTEYLPHQPIRQLINRLRARGKRALVGTSANRCGEPTCTDALTACRTFQGSVAAVLSDSFEHLAPERRRSTSVVDLTGKHPRLHREGSVPEIELQKHLSSLGFGELIVGKDVIKAKINHYS